MLLRRKAYVACVAWCASFAIAAGIYAYHYHSVHENPPTVLTRGVYFFCFLGCALQNRIAAFITGILLTAIFALSIRRRFEQTHPVTFYFTAWIFCSGAVVAWVRGSTSSRYSIYSVLLLIFAYRFLSGYLLQRFSRLRFPHVLVPALALSTALCVSSDVSAFRNLKQRREMVLAGMNIYLESHGTRSPMVDPLVKITWPKEEEFERVILNRAIQDGVLSRPNIAVK